MQWPEPSWYNIYMYVCIFLPLSGSSQTHTHTNTCLCTYTFVSREECSKLWGFLGTRKQRVWEIHIRNPSFDVILPLKWLLIWNQELRVWRADYKMLCRRFRNQKKKKILKCSECLEGKQQQQQQQQKQTKKTGV